MCGITGILSPNPVNITDQRLKSMTGAIAHRGPDGENTWISESGLVGLGHRRLSIIDLSPAGAQPMHYLHRYTIVHTQMREDVLESFAKGFKNCRTRSFLLSKPFTGNRETIYYGYMKVGHTRLCKEEAAIDEFSRLLSTSVNRRLRSDVPVGTS